MVQRRWRFKLRRSRCILASFFAVTGARTTWCWSWAPGCEQSLGPGVRSSGKRRQRAPLAHDGLLPAGSGSFQPAGLRQAGAALNYTTSGIVGGQRPNGFRHPPPCDELNRPGPPGPAANQLAHELMASAEPVDQ